MVPARERAVDETQSERQVGMSKSKCHCGDSYLLEHTDTAISRVHPPAQCSGRHCTIHNRSNHRMRGWPQSYRSDTGVMERICEHGIGHPDPDSPWPEGDRRWVHGCDGCCTRGENQKPEEEK